MCDELLSLCECCDAVIVNGESAALDTILSQHVAHAHTCPACFQHTVFYRAVWLGEDRQEFETSNRLLNELIDSPQTDEILRMRALNYVAMNLDRLDRYSEALRVYEQIVDRCRANDNPLGQARARFNQAVVLNNRLRNPAEALRLLDEAEAALRRADDQGAAVRILNERGIALINVQRWDDAQAALWATHTQCERLGNPYLQAICEINLGNWERLHGDAAAGAQWCTAALALLDQSDELRAEALFYRSEIAQRQGDLAAAEADLDEMLGLAQGSGSQHFAALAHLGRARLAERQADDLRAFGYYQQAVQTIEHIRSAQDISDVRLDFQTQWQTMYPDAVACALRLGRLGDALMFSEHARSRLLLDTIGWSQSDLDALPPEQREDLERMQRELHTGYIRQIEGLIDQVEADALHALERRCAERRADYRRRAQELLPTRVPPALEQLQDSIPSQALIMSYVDTGDHLSVFMVDQRGVRHRALPVSSAQIQARLNQAGQVRDLLPDHRTGRLSRNLRVLHLLHAGLLAPVADLLPDHTTIYLVPDLPLRHIPFHLLTPGPGLSCPLTAGARRLHYLPSASVLTHITPFQPSGELLAIGNNQPNLMLVEAHVHKVAAIGGHRALCGDAAGHLAVTQAINGVAQIYIAGHNQFHPHAPLDSGLLIGDQRLLTLSDLRCLRVPGSRVVLSACQSGLVAAHGGDWIGLISALLQAGAAQIIGSIWHMSEVATCVLMDRFWSALDATGDPETALRQAQEYICALTPEGILQAFSDYDLPPPARSYLADQISALVSALGDPLHPLDHPYYWGPFVVLGV